MEADTRSGRRAVTAAVVGNVLEWYDFAVYIYLAGVVAKTFFPAEDPVTSLLLTFATFGVGFIMRPLGGILIGRLGDVKGRKTALIVTVSLLQRSVAVEIDREWADAVGPRTMTLSERTRPSVRVA